MESGLATPLADGRAPPRLARLARFACVGFGLALGLYLVRGVGFARVAETLSEARAWVPVLVLLELAIVAADAFAAGTLLRGTAGIPSAAADHPPRGAASLFAWIRASALANACAQFLPAGRAAGEAARGATLAPYFGTPRVVAAFARLQACSLLGTATASLVLAALVGLLATGSRALAPLLLGNALLCAAVGGGIFLVIRSARPGTWLHRVLTRFVPSAKPGASPSRRASAQAVGLCTLGRVVQGIQYGVAVLAVGGMFSLTSAATSDGIHLVGASGGDLMPNQVGAMEAAYRYFAEPLGFGEAPARALSIAVLMHGVQVGVALIGLMAAGVLPRGERP